MKKLWKQNRVLFMLIIVLIICFIAILCVALTFFYSKDVSNYGSRLKNIEDYPITETFQKEYKESLLENERVLKSNFLIKGRIVYITINFDDQISLDEAKSVATKTLDKFSEDLLAYYDLQFILKSDNFNIMGAKNSIVDHISWNNNLEIKNEDQSEEK